MIGSTKDWASLLGLEREADEKTMAARGRVLARAIGYLEDHFSMEPGERPAEALVMELGQFLVLAEGMEAKGRGGKFRELYEAVFDLHLNWDDINREEALGAIGKRIAVFRGILAFSDAWLGIETPIPSRAPQSRGAAVEPVAMFDEADVKTRIVRPAHLLP